MWHIKDMDKVARDYTSILPDPERVWTRILLLGARWELRP